MRRNYRKIGLKIGAYSLLISMTMQNIAYASIPFTQSDLDAIFLGMDYRDARDTRTDCSLSASSADAGENAETVWRFFADKLPGHQIAGIIGNMQHESGIQPQRLQSTPSGKITPAVVAVSTGARTGWGLVQWTPASKIITAFQPPSAADNIQNQLRFLWDQLEGRAAANEKAAGDLLKETGSPSEATEVFMRKYERPASYDSLPERIATANAIYARLNETIPTVEAPVNSPTPADGAAQTSYTSECAAPESAGSITAAALAEHAKGPVENDENVMKYTDGNIEKWCADFVSWVLRESGNELTGGVSGGWRIPSVLSMQSLFQNNPDDYEYFNVGEKVPQPGDIAFYIGNQTPDEGNDRHVNIVLSVDGDTMQTIGGNERNTVKISTRPISFGANSLVGFGRVL